jgi:hypothetical protein
MDALPFASRCDSSRKPGRSIRIQFQQMFCDEIPNQAASATVGARFDRAARASREQLVD